MAVATALCLLERCTCQGAGGRLPRLARPGGHLPAAAARCQRRQRAILRQGWQPHPPAQLLGDRGPAHLRPPRRSACAQHPGARLIAGQAGPGLAHAEEQHVPRAHAPDGVARPGLLPYSLCGGTRLAWIRAGQPPAAVVVTPGWQGHWRPRWTTQLSFPLSPSWLSSSMRLHTVLVQGSAVC